MYYSYQCSYCRKTFYTYSGSSSQAASTLYYGIKKHLIDYDEDHKEFEFDEHPQIEVHQMYNGMIETKEPPSGGYEL